MYTSLIMLGLLASMGMPGLAQFVGEFWNMLSGILLKLGAYATPRCPRAQEAGACEGSTPSCCNWLSWSTTCQCSTIRPSVRRWMSIPEIV